MSDDLQNANITLGKAGITGLSGAATTFSTSAAGGLTSLPYAIKGIIKTLANQSSAATPTNDASTSTAVAGTAATGSAFRPLVAQQTPAGYSPNIIYTGSACVFVFGVDTSGNVRVAQGPVAPYTDTSALSTPLQWPVLPDWFCPFSYAVIKLVSTTSASWVFGTNNWNSTGITIDTPVDITVIPQICPITA